MTDEIMNIEEVAQFLRVSERTVAREVKAGRLKAFRVGHSLRFKREVVEEYMNNQEVRPGERLSEDVGDAA